MPLPKAPTKRADMLLPADFESQPKPAKSTKSTKAGTGRVTPVAAPRVVAAPVLEVVPRTPASPAPAARTKPVVHELINPVAERAAR